MHWKLIGWTILAVAGLDVFLTVLYARDQAGLLVSWLNRLLWHGGRLLARTRLPGANYALTFWGPGLLVLNPLIWIAAFVLGFACLYYPTLGEGLTASSGPTRINFVTALYYSGFCFSTLGVGDLEPRTEYVEALTILQALLGFALLTMVLTYLQSVYSSIVSQNAFASYLHGLSGYTGDAAVMLRRIHLQKATADLPVEFAQRLNAIKECHHSYPIVQYFRFAEVEYSLVRVLFLCLDAATIHEAVRRASARREDRGQTPHLSVVAEAAMDVARKIHPRLLFMKHDPRRDGRRDAVDGDALPLEDVDGAWRARFHEAVETLEPETLEPGANSPLSDERVRAEAEEMYVRLRKQWNGTILQLGDLMTQPWHLIDPALARCGDRGNAPPTEPSPQAAFHQRFAEDGRTSRGAHSAPSTPPQ